MWEAKEMLYNPDGTINSQGQEEVKDGVINAIPVIIEKFDAENLIQAILNSENQPESNDEKVLKITYNTYKIVENVKLENDTTIMLNQY